MLRECGRLRGHVVAALSESENVRRLLEGATGAEDAEGVTGTLDEGAHPSGWPRKGGGQ